MRALFVVEPDFHRIHPGVRRVIAFHDDRLRAQDYEVTFATTQNGRLVTGDGETIRAKVYPTTPGAGAPLIPCWDSRHPGEFLDRLGVQIDQNVDLPWEAELPIGQTHFDAAVFTNPWLCSNEFSRPDADLSIGIVYDLIPNMLSMASLAFPTFVNIYEFAHQHAIGFEYFRRNVDVISCISESSRTLLAEHYGPAEAPELVTHIPFSDFGSGLRSGDASHILLVNVLDARKNFATVQKVVQAVGTTQNIDVTVVGRERIAPPQVREFLEALAECASSVRWFRSPSDADLDSIMNDAGVLLFPSFFEGLGLPILEAQAKGIPAVSSNTSSCGEINMNPSLAVGPTALDALADAVMRVLDRDPGVSRDQDLRNRQRAFLDSRSSLIIDRPNFTDVAALS